MSDLLYPSADAVLALLDEVTRVLVQSSLVRTIMCFGSVARGTPDRWSDIDLIVVTDTRRAFVDVLDCLQQHKPIVHRNQFVPYAEPSGGHILGILFEGCSVFHCIDLNLLTWQEYTAAELLARFGVTKEIYHSAVVVMPEHDTEIAAEEEDPTEAEIKWRVHFTKKLIKKVLRGENRRDELAKYAALLRDVMRDYPADLMIAGRRIGYLATTYLQMADRLLNS
jgi:predicted nucleotidyltransferase